MVESSSWLWGGMARRISTVAVRDRVVGALFCTHLDNLFRYRSRGFAVVGHSEIFTKLVQRHPVLVVVVVGILGDGTVYGSREFHLPIRLATIVQLDFIHVLWK